MSIVNGSEKLIDYSRSGKPRDWTKKKQQSRSLASVFRECSERAESDAIEDKYKGKYLRTLTCGNELLFGVDSNNHKELVGANFCKERLCPMCSWRRSRKNAMRLYKALEEFDLNKYRPVLLTLTIPNCQGEDLRDTLKELTRSFNRLSKYKAFKNATVGFWRSTEITRNKKDGTYHPHLHVLLLMQSGYFSKDKDIYLTQVDWTKLWQRASKSLGGAIVDVRPVRKGGLQGAVAEVSKYITKSDDYLTGLNLDEMCEVVELLNVQIAGLRFEGSGGIIKARLHELYGADIISDDDDLLGDDELPDDIKIVMYVYDGNDYILYKELTRAEWQAYRESRRSRTRAPV